MNKQKHIFEVKQMINGKGWSCITPAEFTNLDYFTQQFILDNIEDADNYEPKGFDVVLGCGQMFWANEEEEF